MRNFIDNIAIALVVLFSVALVVLIVQYNLIKEESLELLTINPPIDVQSKKAQQKTDYLKKMEAYKEVNVKVNPKEEKAFNNIKVKSEITQDKLNAIIEPNRADTVGDALDKLLN